MLDENEHYSLDDIDENEKIGVLNQPDSDLGVETLKMLEGVGAPEKKMILSPELQRAKVIFIDDEETARIGKYTAESIDDIGRHMDSVSTFPVFKKPLFIEYNHAARFNNIETEVPLAEGRGVPDRVGLLVFRDPEDSRLINMFVVWNDCLGGLYHSYAILVIDEEKLDIISSKRHMRGSFREDNIPDIIEASTVILPERFKDEMFTLHDMDAVNDPRRNQAVKETQKRVMAEYPFFLATMIYLSSKDKNNTDFGLSNPFRPSVFTSIKEAHDKLCSFFKEKDSKKVDDFSKNSKENSAKKSTSKVISDRKFMFESELGVSRTPASDQMRHDLINANKEHKESSFNQKS